MARPRKEGLDYFPLDVGFFEEDAVQLVTAEFGFKAELIIIRLLCKIYRNGYYYEWGKDECFLLSKAIGAVDCSAKFVSEVVNGLVRRCFFDKECYDSFGVLTSTNIQETFKLAVSKSRRKLDTGCMQYWLLPNEVTPETIINSEETPINSEETPEITALSAQSKVKEIKVNKSKENVKENISLSGEITESERESFFEIFFFKNFIDPESEVDNFINHYSSTDKGDGAWYRANSSTPIYNKVSLAKTWKESKENASKPRRFYPAFLTKLEVVFRDSEHKATIIRSMIKSEFTNDGVSLYFESAIRQIFDSIKPKLDEVNRVAFPNLKVFYQIKK